MKNTITTQSSIRFSRAGELVLIEPAAPGAIRFRAFPDGRVIDEDYTLMPKAAPCTVENNDRSASMTCGDLKVVLFDNGRTEWSIKGKKILEEKPEMTFSSGIRNFQNIGSGLWKARASFFPNENEHFFGMGHSWDSVYDQKGSAHDIRNVNAKCSMPYVWSSLGYGFIWNVPSTGSCEFGKTRTRWQSDCCHAIDYVVIAGDPKTACHTLSELTGYAPKMPEWAAGFWQSRLRYETQEELLSVARRYRDMGLPLAAIVADYFHWTEQGDYKFDPKYWPDVRAMADELHEMGTKLVVSMWPTINPASENYRHMSDNNMLMRTTHGSDRVFDFYGPQAEIDATNPETREYVWQKLKENYIDMGVDALWYDEAEPEVHPEQFDNLIWHAGRADKVALLYPYYYSKMAFDGFTGMGRDVITLTRCAYLGSQKYGSLVWSGDIPSTFESFRHQIAGGLNMAMCGIPWWNTDIGGFYGADIQSDEFRELIVRWFQYGVFCPVMRLHGSRVKKGPKTPIIEPSGDPNEIWSFGEENEKILADLILLRERLKPYILEQMAAASEKGWPVMRPMFFEWPEDETCFTTGDQFLFGPDILVAPIAVQGAVEREVYIPGGEWILPRTGEEFGPGWHNIHAELNEYIALVRKGAPVLGCF